MVIGHSKTKGMEAVVRSRVFQNKGITIIVIIMDNEILHVVILNLPTTVTCNSTAASFSFSLYSLVFPRYLHIYIYLLSFFSFPPPTSPKT